MTKRLAVPTAIAALIARVLPQAVVLAPVDDGAAPARVADAGSITVSVGDPGEPTLDLSPLAYNYEHRVGVDIAAPSELELDAMLAAIGAAIVADRTLGALVDWLDTAAPGEDELYVQDGGQPPRGANLVVTAFYATSTPI